MELNKDIKPVGYYGFPNNADADGRRMLNLMYNVRGEKAPVKHSMKMRLHPTKDWDAKKQRIRSSYPQATMNNKRLVDFKAKIDALIQQYDGRITKELIADMMSGVYLPDEEKAKRETFPKYALRVNDILYKRGDFGYSSYYNKKKLIEAFDFYVRNIMRIKNFMLVDITREIIDGYVGYRFNELGNKSREGVYKTIVPLKDAVQYAVNEGLLEMKNVAGILDYRINQRETRYVASTEEGEVKALTKEQMQALCDYQAKENRARTKEILDMFFFSFYACGLRLSDVLTLEWQHVDINERIISKNQFKTKARVDIPLNDSALEILNRWQSYARNSRFVFNLLPEDFDLEDQNAIFMQRNSKDKTFNTSLKAISKKLGFPLEVKFHMARHTFAVMSINNMVPLHVLSVLMGHSSVVATEKTYAKYLKSTLDAEMKEKMNFPFTPVSDD